MFRRKNYYVTMICFCLMGCLVSCGVGDNESQEITGHTGKGDIAGPSCDPKMPKSCAEDNDLVCVAKSIDEPGTCQVFKPEANMSLGAGYMCGGLSFANCADGLVCEMANVSPDITDIGGTCVLASNACDPKQIKACGEDNDLVCAADSINTTGQCVKFEWDTPLVVGAGYPCGGELAANKRCAQGLECKYSTNLPPDITDVGGICTLTQNDKTKACEDLNEKYNAAVLQAASCSKSAPTCIEEQELPSKLKCPLPRGVFVNANASLETLKSLRDQWKQLECGTLSTNCPAYAPIPDWMKIVGECNFTVSACVPKIVNK